jgi:hypothetical protein
MSARQLNLGFFPQQAIASAKRCGVESLHVHGGTAMRIPAARPLFAWDCLEDSPSLATIRQFLQALPDARLLDSLRQWRGKGRDDYPIHTCWGVIVLTILLRHPHIETCLGELRRNAALRQLIGIDSEAQVPKAWNMTRFMEVLGIRIVVTLYRPDRLGPAEAVGQPEGLRVELRDGLVLGGK